MKQILTLTLFILGLHAFAQDLDCNDFKNGTFKAEVSDPVKFQWKIVREGSQQTEFISELPQEYKDLGYSTDPHYGIIKWIDECSYLLTYDESKAELTDAQKYINQSGGVLTELVKIEGDCFYYQSSTKIEGVDLIRKGKLCRQ